MSREFRKAFGERTLFALSFLALAGSLAEILTEPSPQELLAIELFDWSVIGILTVEYVLGLSSSRVKSSYFRSRSNLLTVAIIGLALCGAVFSLPILFSAPLLRLVRSLKVSIEAGRSSTELTPAES